MRLKAPSPPLPSSLRAPLAALALGLAYLVVAYLSTSLWRTETALLWPASGLYLGVLLASSRRLWPHLAVGVLLGSLAANLLAGHSPAVSLAFAVPSCAEGLLGAVLVLRLAQDRFTLERTRDVVALVAGAAIVANGLTALSAAAAAVEAFNTPFGESWLRWWSADALGIAAVAPAVVMLLRSGLLSSRPERPAREQLDQLALSVASLVVLVLVFRMAEPREVSAVVAGMVGLPLLVWAGWHWSMRAVALLTAALAIAVTYIASLEADGFGPGPLSTADMHVMQAFLATLVLGALAVGAVAAERRCADRRLARSRDRLKRLVEAAPDAYLALADDDRIEEWGPGAEAAFGWPRAEAVGRRLHETIVPEGEHEAWRAELERRTEGDGLSARLLPAEHRDGHEVTVELSGSRSSEGGSQAVHLFIRDVSERERVRTQLHEARELVESRARQLTEAEQRIEGLGEELRHKALQLERVGQERSRLHVELQHAEGQEAVAVRSLAEAREEGAARETELAMLREELDSAHAARDTRERKLEEAQQARRHLKNVLAESERRLASAELRAESMVRELERARSECSRVRAKLAESEASAAAARVALERTQEGFAEQRAELERTLTERSERLAEVDDERELLARRGTDLVARYDARGICLYASPACRALVGYEPEELVGRQGAELLHRDDLPLLNRARAADGDTTFNARLRRRDGSLTEAEATFSPIRDAQGGLTAIEASVRRVPAASRVERAEPRAEAGPRSRLQPLTDHDPLTGLFGRTRFEEELRGHVAAAGRYDMPGAVLAVDLDRFRELNGLLGHACTDDLLRAVSRAFRGRLRTTDVLGRTDDDQFAVVLPRAAESQAGEVAGALLEAVREVGRTELGAGSLRLTASVGIACFGDGLSVSAEELLVEAAIAVQDAKQAGGDSMAGYDGSGDPPVAAGERFGWAEQIRAALRDDRLVLHGEPVVGLAGDRLVRHELLPRMVGAGGEIVPAAVFLPAVARAGLGGEVDRWLLGRAIELLAREQRAGGDPRLEVALTAGAPPDADLVAFVAEELRAAGADGRGLALTIPETTALRGGGSAGLALRRLTELGCDVGLDAFGTGLASFLHVEGLPVAYLKLDEGLVERLGASQGARLMVRSIAAIARSLGRRTVARSVPDRETLRLLRRLGIGYAQGPAVADPRPAEDLRLSEPREALSS